MVVLTIIGLIVGLMALYIFIEYLNSFSMSRYSYEFFSIAHFIQVIIGYWISYFGNSLYTKALRGGGDLLNGQLLISIGVVVVMLVIYKNFKTVPFHIALAFTFLQLALSLPLAVGAFFILIIGVAVLAETKPVYVLNN